MKHASFALLFVIGACADPPSVAGTYDGTVTVVTAGGLVVATAAANVDPEEIGVTVGSSGSTRVDALLQGMSTSGSSLHFECSRVSCSCTVGATDVRVTTAAGSMEHDVLSLSFSGESTTGEAVSATFMGALQPGTR